MQQVISRVLEDRTGPITTEDIALAGTALRLEWTADAVIGALRANRLMKKPSPVSDDFTITIGELRAAFKRAPAAWARPGSSPERAVDWIARDIEDHREPDWQPGDVVKDAYGRFWKRTFGDKSHSWASFETALRSSFDTPKRPLEKIS